MRAHAAGVHTQALVIKPRALAQHVSLRILARSNGKRTPMTIELPELPYDGERLRLTTPRRWDFVGQNTHEAIAVAGQPSARSREHNEQLQPVKCLERPALRAR